MKPWVVDAKDIEPEDLDQFHGQLLHLNNQIADFLDPSATEEMLIIAPKGFGKTLLLKAKRQSMRQRYGTMLPERALVDKPSANPDLMSHREYGSVRETEAYWKALWSIALTLAVEKHLGVCPTLVGPLEKLVRNEQSAQRLRPVHQPAGAAARRLFRGVQGLCGAPAAGVPAHPQLDRHVRRQYRRVFRGFPGRRSGRQRGAARDLPQLLALRPGRHRARGARPARDQQPRQDLRLDPQGGVPADLFGQPAGAAAGRLRDRPALLARGPGRDHPQEHRRRAQAQPGRHVGQGSRGCASSGRMRPGSCIRRTGDEEDVGAFWIRHTFRRPRDIAFIGRDLAAIDPRRRTRETVRQQITRSAAAIAQGFITEMSPHLPQFDREILFRLIRRNVIPWDELAFLDEQYDRMFAARQGGGEPVACHVFASMFKIGLLGYVGMHPETAELVQFFRYPGEVPLDRNDVLPDAEHFLVHPSLDLLIGGYNPDYFRHLDKLNVIGADRPWRAGAADACSCSRATCAARAPSSRTRSPAPTFRASSPRRWPKPAVTWSIARSMDGDAALLVDPNPRQVVLAALALRQRLLRSDYGCEMRFGGDAGFVELAEDGAGPQARAGLALLVAARLEPHATPGTILVTGQFVDAWRDLLGAGGLHARPVEPREVPLLRESDGRFDLAKPGGEAPMLRRLMFLDGPTLDE